MLNNLRFKASSEPKRNLPYTIVQAQKKARDEFTIDATETVSPSSPEKSNSPLTPQPRDAPVQGRRHVFQPSQNPKTLRWAPPVYSARRTKLLVDAAFREGKLLKVPNCPQKTAILAKLQRQEDTNKGILPRPSYRLSKEDLKRGSPTEKHTEQMELIAKIALAKGPYVGRSVKKTGLRRFFKGTAEERSRRSKDQKIAGNMQRMKDTVREWRQTKQQAKSKARPSQPF